MTTTQNLVAGRIQFKNAVTKLADFSISTKRDRDYRSRAEVVSVRNANFESIFWADETRDGAIDTTPVWFKIDNLNDYTTVKLVKAGFQTRLAIELTYGGSEKVVTYWAAPKN